MARGQLQFIMNNCYSVIKEMARQGRKDFASAALFDKVLYFFTLLTPICFWIPWELNMFQRLCFAFGVFTLWGVSFFSPKQREQKNKYLGAAILWSLLSGSLHIAAIKTGSMVNDYICFGILSEGLLFILCGCLLFNLIFTYSRNFNIAYPLLIISILNLFFAFTQKIGIHLIWSNIPTIGGLMGTQSQLTVFSAVSIPILGHLWYPLALIPIVNMFLVHSYTGVLALFMAIAFYLCQTKQLVRLLSWIAAGLLFIAFNFHQLWIKLLIRLDLWETALKEIIQSPIFGKGFDNTFSNNMIYSNVDRGWTFRHNDYLNIARDLGLPFLIILIIGVWKIMKKPKLNYLSVSILTLLIASCFQTSMYFSRIAGTGVILLALKASENYAEYKIW